MWLHWSDTKSDFAGLFDKGNFPLVQNLQDNLFDVTLNSLSNERENGRISELVSTFDSRREVRQEKYDFSEKN